MHGLLWFHEFWIVHLSLAEVSVLDMLSPHDMSVDSHVSPSHLAVHLKRNKNVPYVEVMILHLGTKAETLCTILSMLGYLAIRPSTPGALFLFKNSPRLSGPRLIQPCTRFWEPLRWTDSGQFPYWDGNSCFKKLKP